MATVNVRSDFVKLIRRILWLFFLVFPYSLAVAAEPGIDIAELGGWCILVAEDAQLSHHYAAEEFQSLLQAAAGMELPIEFIQPDPASFKQSPPRKAVLIGAVARLAMFSDLPAFGPEEVAYRVDKQRIGVAGGAPRGTLYAVYELFEKLFEVRFLTCDHTHIPPRGPGFSIPLCQHSYQPPFASFRWTYYKENADDHAFATRRRVNTLATEEKYGGKARQNLIGHTFSRWLPVRDYGEEHPEYFALVNGQRLLEADWDAPQLCVTCPQVIEIVSRAVIAHLDAHPELANVSVSQSDNDEYCTCSTCEEINQREGTPMGSHLTFVNAVAERVERRHPHVKVGTLAYWYTRKPPATIVPRSNVQIQLCSIECCTLHALNDPHCFRNRQFCRDVEGWKRISDSIWMWNYNTNFKAYHLPFPNLRSIGDNVRFFRDQDIRGVFMQANGNSNAGEFCDLRNYVISGCLWDPRRDSWELAEEFCQLHYGRAAEPILEHLRMIHDNAESAGVHPECFPAATAVGLTPEIAAKSLALFERAVQLADNDVIRRRVEKASLCAYKAAIALSSIRWGDGVARLDFHTGSRNILDRYLALCGKYNSTRAGETLPLEESVQSLLRYNDGVPTISAETDLWRVTAIPEDNGNIIELRYFPAGHNLVDGPSNLLVDRQRSHEERGRCGYDHTAPLAFAGQVSDHTLRLRKVLSDGSTLVRTVRLGSRGKLAVRIEFTITHQGKHPKTYQFEVHPEYDADTTSHDPHVLSGLIKDQDWLLVNEDWVVDRGPGASVLANAKGGEFAFYNHEKDFGVLQSYDPELFEQPRFYWKPPTQQVHLELVTKAVELAPGESFSYRYDVLYLENPP